MGKRFFELKTGEVIWCEDLTKQKAADFLKNTPHHKDSSLSASDYDVYALEDGQAMIIAESYATLYNGVEDVHKVIEDYNGSSVSHVLSGKKIDQDFPDESIKLMEKFLTQLHIDGSNYDSGQDLLTTVDTHIQKFLSDPLFYQKHFVDLIAVIGNCITRDLNCKWQMIYNSEYKVWEPHILFSGKQTEFFVWLWEDIYQTQGLAPSICSETYLTYIAVNKK